MTFKKIINSIVKWYKLIGLYVLRFVKKHYLLVGMIAMALLAVAVRLVFFRFPTHDMCGYVLNGWMAEIDQIGFTNFYQVNSDYSPLYLFVIAILCLFPKGNQITVNDSGGVYTFFENRMFYVKALYALITIALAFGVYLLVKELTGSKKKAFFGYVILLALPTVFVNSAIWGNADVIYGTLMVYSFYYMLKEKNMVNSIMTFVFFGLAFAFKAQALFMLPILVLLLASRRLRLWTVVFIPLAYFATFIPAFLFGASIAEPFHYLTMQFGGQTDIVYGSANIWKFLELDNSDIVRNSAMWVSLLVVGALTTILYFRNIDYSKKENIFKVGFLLTMSMVFFLPRMHERYFYIIDILVVVYALIDKKRFWLVPLMQLSSAIAYFHYLTGHYFIDIIGENSVTLAAIMNLVILVTAFYDVIKLEHIPLKQEIEDMEKEINLLKEDNQEEQQEEKKEASN